MIIIFKFLRILFVLICLVIIYVNFSQLLLYTNIFNNNNCENCDIEIKSALNNSINKKLENKKLIEENLFNNFNEENYNSYFYILFDCNNYTKCEINNESQNIRKKCIDKDLNFCFFDYKERENLLHEENNFYTYCLNSLSTLKNKDILCTNYKIKDNDEKKR